MMGLDVQVQFGPVSYTHLDVYKRQMLYVVVEELIPEMSQGQLSNIGTLFFALGFSLMMILDVAQG